MFAFRSWLGATILAIGSLAAGTTAVQAHDCGCCHYEWVCRDVCVTDYVVRCVPYTKCVTTYDSCGCPHIVTRICYHDIRVPVTRHVTVKERIKVCP